MLTSVAGWMLQMRNVMITTIGEDYVVAAQAKGLSNRRVIFTYAARNALLPQLQGFGLALGFVVSGAMVMEIVFSYPGIGLLLLNAVTSNDYPLMQAIFLVITFAVLIANFIVDLVIVLVRSASAGKGVGSMRAAAQIVAEPADQGQGRRGPARHVRPRRDHRPAGRPVRPGVPEPVAEPVAAAAVRRSTCSAPPRAARTCSPSCWPASGSRSSWRCWSGVIATALSVIVGVTSAFLGGVWDELLSLLTNVFLVIPALPLLILLLGYLPGKGQLPTIIVLTALGWQWGARVIRAQTLTIRNRDFIAASRESGEKTWRIIVFEIIPNEVSLIAASFVNTVLYAIGASVALAFIGLADLNSWSLGTMLYWAQSQQALQLGAWWWFLPPGIAVALIGTSLVLLNTGFDELGSPRLRASRGARQDRGPPGLGDRPDPGARRSSPPRRGRVCAFLHSFSRSSLLDETPAGGELR